MHDVCSEKRAVELIKRGRMPFIHPAWAWHSFAEAQLVEIIKDCFVYDPNERMSITDLVQRLRQAAWENRRREGYPGR